MKYASKNLLSLFLIVRFGFVFSLPVRGGSAGVLTYGPIPGIEPSTRFAARVHDGNKWLPLFTMETVGPDKTREGIYSRGIYESVTGLSASWCTFETDQTVTVEITKLSPGDIDTCVIRPLSRQLTAVISQDKRTVRVEIPPRFEKETTTDPKQVPVNIAVEINGQSDEIITVFASPHLSGKPGPEDPGVFQVHPGHMPPVEGEWHTLYFMPGVHDLGKKAHPLRPGKHYYIPGNAWVDGSFGEGFNHHADDAKIFGLGVISGRKIGWLEIEKGSADKSIHLFGANTVLEGLTFINSPYHTWMAGSKDPERPTVFRNLKAHNWRKNTDGLHFFGSGIAEDIFYHGQDDSHYVASAADRVRFRRWVYWRDNTYGADIIFSANGPQHTPGDSITEDGDSIYNKSRWKGIIFDQRGLKPGNWVDGAVIRDFRIENPGTNGPLIRMQLPSHPCSFKNILFQRITAYRDNGIPFEITGGGPDAVIENITFEDIRMGNRWIEDFSAENFRLTFVKNLRIVRDGKTVATYSSDIEADAKQIRPDPDNLLRNPGLEIRDFAWDGRQVDASTVPPSAGKAAYQMTERIGKSFVLRQEVTGQIESRNGGRYRLSAKIRLLDGRGKCTLMFHFGQVNRQTGDRYVDDVLLEEVPLKSGEWVQISGELTLPWDREKFDWLRWVRFQVQASGEFSGVYVDDCRLEHLGTE